jgi:uncharacterized protein YbaA (DUF1428 family)
VPVGHSDVTDGIVRETVKTLPEGLVVDLPPEIEKPLRRVFAGESHRGHRISPEDLDGRPTRRLELPECQSMRIVSSGAAPLSVTCRLLAMTCEVIKDASNSGLSRSSMHTFVAWKKITIPTPAEETAMSYIDGFVIAVPNASREQFIAHAHTFDATFLKFGATRVVECWGDNVPEGKLTDFRRAVQAEKDESVVFSWVEWPDKATRDAGMEKFMIDPSMEAASDVPFDGKRMIFGGFVPVVSLPA